MLNALLRIIPVLEWEIYIRSEGMYTEAGETFLSDSYDLISSVLANSLARTIRSHNGEIPTRRMDTHGGGIQVHMAMSDVGDIHLE